MKTAISIPDDLFAAAERAANVSQVLTIDRRFCTRRAGHVVWEVMAEVESGLRLALSL